MAAICIAAVSGSLVGAFNLFMSWWAWIWLGADSGGEHINPVLVPLGIAALQIVAGVIAAANSRVGGVLMVFSGTLFLTMLEVRSSGALARELSGFNPEMVTLVLANIGPGILALLASAWPQPK